MPPAHSRLSIGKSPGREPCTCKHVFTFCAGQIDAKAPAVLGAPKEVAASLGAPKGGTHSGLFGSSQGGSVLGAPQRRRPPCKLQGDRRLLGTSQGSGGLFGSSQGGRRLLGDSYFFRLAYYQDGGSNILRNNVTLVRNGA